MRNTTAATGLKLHEFFLALIKVRGATVPAYSLSTCLATHALIPLLMFRRAFFGVPCAASCCAISILVLALALQQACITVMRLLGIVSACCYCAHCCVFLYALLA
jgi:hypothetical protein